MFSCNVFLARYVVVMGIEFAGLHRFWIIVPFSLICFFVIRYYFFTKARITQLVHSKWRSVLLLNFSEMRQLIKVFLFVVALGAFFIAFLQPRFGDRSSTRVQEGRELLVVLDVSRSMLAQDARPNRIEFAKRKILMLLEKMAFERVGLILFCDSAYTYCPLTADFGAFELFLRNVRAETFAIGTTAVDRALDEAIKNFVRVQDRKNRLVLLLTDGEDFSSNLLEAKHQAREHGIIVYALGIGTQSGAPIPIVNLTGEVIGHEKDADGKPYLSRLNEEFLEALCREFSGMYIRAASDDRDVSEIASLVRYEKDLFETRNSSEKEERFPLFLLVGFICLLFEWVL